MNQNLRLMMGLSGSSRKPTKKKSSGAGGAGAVWHKPYTYMFKGKAIHVAGHYEHPKTGSGVRKPRKSTAREMFYGMKLPKGVHGY